jgi:arabinofuranan 3-O-arabinosyltransferase
VQGRYGLDVLRFSESMQSVSASSSPTEVLRGLGYWFFYGHDQSVDWNAAVRGYTNTPALGLSRSSGRCVFVRVA